jgi:hypothetical protein
MQLLTSLSVGVGHFGGGGRVVPPIREKAPMPDSFYESFHLSGPIVFAICALLITILAIAYFWEPIKKYFKKTK